MNRPIRYARSRLLVFSLALVAAMASAGEPPPPAKDNADQSKPEDTPKRPGDGIKTKAEPLPPLVGVKGPDGRIVVQHANEATGSTPPAPPTPLGEAR